MVEVHSIDNLLLSVFDYLPDGATDHVSSWKGSDGQAVPFPCRGKGKVFSTINSRYIMRVCGVIKRV